MKKEPTRIKVHCVNDINECFFDHYEKFDFDIFFLIISKLCNKTSVRIPYSEIKKILGGSAKRTWKSNEEFSKKLDETCFKIMHGGIVPIRKDDKKGYIALYTECYADDAKEYVEVVVNSKCEDFFVEYWKHFRYTTFDLNDFVNLKSKYTKILYRLLTQYYETGHYYITSEDFNRLFCVPKTYTYNNIKQRILNPAMAELQALEGGKFKDLELTVKRKGDGLRSEIIYYDFKCINHTKIKEVYGDPEEITEIPFT